MQIFFLGLRTRWGGDGGGGVCFVCVCVCGGGAPITFIY